MSPVDPSKLDDVYAKIEAKYGKGQIGHGDKTPVVSRVPTGMLEFDWATNGGIPRGRMVHFWGGWSSGKSLMSWRTIAEFQALGLACAYYNIEKQYDPTYAKALGIDTKKLTLVQDSTIEGVGEKLEALLGVCHLHVIDSITTAVSRDELAGELDDWHVGLGPRAWGKVLRRANERMDDIENTIIYINQARASFSMGGGRGENEHAPGGKFIEHSSSLTVHFRKGKWLHHDKDGFLDPDATPVKSWSGDQEPKGMEYVARVQKSRIGPPLRAARMRYDLDARKFDTGYELVKAAQFTGVAVETGSGRFEIDGQKIHGRKNLRAAFDASPALAKQVRDALLSKTV